MSGTIDSLREQLDISWQGGNVQDKDVENGEVDTVAFLSINLTEQLGYSNSLLQDVNTLEASYSKAQQIIAAQDNEIFELTEVLKSSQNTVVELQNKVEQLQSETDDTIRAYDSLLVSNNQLSEKLERVNNENELYNNRLKQHGEIELNQTKQIADLETEIQYLKHKEQESNRLDSSVNSKLSYENASYAAEIEELRKGRDLLHDNFIIIRDENILLKKSLERYQRLNNEETSAKDELSRITKDITSQNVEINNELQEAMQQNIYLEQQVALLRHTLEETKNHLHAQTEKFESQSNTQKLLNVIIIDELL